MAESCTARAMVRYRRRVLAAELHGKVSSQVLQADDARREDTLTSAVFGALQYMPRAQALRGVLTAAFEHLTWSEADCAAATLSFWPTFYDGTEPDVLITVGRRLVVIEAKYGAGFGLRQLEREWHGAQQVARARGLDTVLLLVVTKTLGAEPAEVGDFRRKAGLDRAVTHLSWQQIGLTLDDIPLETHEAQDLRADVLAVMEKRGVRHVYTGIDEEDWWLVSAAQRTARKRVYPQIASLARELQQTLEPDGIRWGTSEDKVVHFHSFSLNSPRSWARSYLQLPLWPVDFATAGRGRSWWATFQVLFDFLNAEVTIGYLTRPQSVSDAKRDWVPGVPALLAAIGDLSEDWRLTTSHGNYAALTLSKHPKQWVDAELVESLSAPACALVVERRLPSAHFTGGAQARAMLLECVEAVRARPVLLPHSARTTEGVDKAPTTSVADDDALDATETGAVEDAAAGTLDE